MKKQRVSVVGTVLTVEYPTIGKKFTVDFSHYGELIQAAATAHGFKQKFGDAASGGSPTEKLNEVNAIHASLMAGEWERTATPDLTPIICEAIARIKRVPLAKVEKAAEKAGEDAVKKWGQNSNVRAEILKIRAEKAARIAETTEEEIDIDLK